MLLDVLLIVGTLEKSIGNSVKITFSVTGEDDRSFANGLEIIAEWIVEREVIRLTHIIPALQLADANSQTELESVILVEFVHKAKVGYLKKVSEIRQRMEMEIRNGTKTQECKN
jgi:hypothetical protein